MPSKMAAILGGAMLAVAVGVVAAFALRSGGDDTSTAPPSASAVALRGGQGPWSPGESGLTTRLKKSGVPFSNMEGTAIHIHPQLTLFIDGAEMPLTANIGISPADQAMAALHTHDDSGTIHVESPIVRTYTLGEFFDVWGVRLTKTCVGGYCSNTTRRLQAFVDGKPFAGDPRTIVLKNAERITLAYGTLTQIAGRKG
jgi:hypothetical protein